jgi:hypothetical protein
LPLLPLPAGADLKRDESAQLQDRRQGRLAVKLAAILDGYHRDNREAFVTNLTKMAASLVTASYGELMLHTIGFIYEKQVGHRITPHPCSSAVGGWVDGWVWV